MMSAIEHVDWDTVDYDRVVGQYVSLPDGSQFYLEMDMLCWYWVSVMPEQGSTLDSVVAEAIEVLSEDPEPFDGEDITEVVKTGILEYGREWVRLTEGK